VATFLIWPAPGTEPGEADFPDLGALLAVVRRPYAVDVWNPREQRWEMLDEVIEGYRKGGAR
jgi:hypothetical protein